tara:strand:+ start:419 stop:676 length:258 start_codon:yes stop_codon:yes gene_type:complete
MSLNEDSSIWNKFARAYKEAGYQYGGDYWKVRKKRGDYILYETLELYQIAKYKEGEEWSVIVTSQTPLEIMLEWERLEAEGVICD